MLTTLSNITRLTDSFVQSLFYKFWAMPIFMYVSSVYIFCLVVICLCMYFNRRDNLIYKVLNLAVLSVFVVALWSYLTDVTFIYVVYILTFVSAVVMLFLSVVLMLPTSAVAVPKRAANYVLFVLLIIQNDTIFYVISFVVALAAVYGLYAFYTAAKDQSLARHRSIVTLECIATGLGGRRSLEARSLVENFMYVVAVNQNGYSPSAGVGAELDDLSNGAFLLHGYNGPYPVHLAVTPTMFSG